MELSIFFNHFFNHSLDLSFGYGSGECEGELHERHETLRNITELFDRYITVSGVSTAYSRYRLDSEIEGTHIMIGNESKFFLKYLEQIYYSG